jgi:hypothetical protein
MEETVDEFLGTATADPYIITHQQLCDMLQDAEAMEVEQLALRKGNPSMLRVKVLPPNLKKRPREVTPPEQLSELHEAAFEENEARAAKRTDHGDSAYHAPHQAAFSSRPHTRSRTSDSIPDP